MVDKRKINKRRNILTDQQEAFCQHYALTKNGAEAARRAGYAHSVAKNTASKLLKLPKVQDRVAELSDTMIVTIDVVKELEGMYNIEKAKNNTTNALKVLDVLARIRGNKSEGVERSMESLERDIIRFLEIIGEEKSVELLSRCKWNYSLPTPDEQDPINNSIDEDEDDSESDQQDQDEEIEIDEDLSEILQDLSSQLGEQDEQDE